MSPDKIRELLTEACPELGWVIEGDRVCAEGTKLYAAMHRRDWTSVTVLCLLRPKGDPVNAPTASLLLAAAVTRLLTQAEIRSAPGARLLVARVDLHQARELVTLREVYVVKARDELAEREARLAEAKAALAKAEAHAAKVGA